MIKRRTRPQSSIREATPEKSEESPPGADESEEELLVSDLVELRQLRKIRQGIDATKLHKGDVRRKKKKKEGEEEGKYGLQTYVTTSKDPVDEDDHADDKDAKARKAVRANNFTQQTNVLDVDKHMMAYIEENMKLRNKSDKTLSEEGGPRDPQDEIFDTARWNIGKKDGDGGSVSNSLTMLTAIPEVDLGMDARLKNIEETEKAKRAVAEGRMERAKVQSDEEHLVATRFYRPELHKRSDADILRDAKLEAMGFRAPPSLPRQENVSMATDEIVMERFKKRMRKL